MSKTRATNNRTITVAEDEKPLLRSFITLPDQINGTELQDTIINADLFDVIDLVTDEVADLIIIDPPYNLTKDFNGNTFSARSSDDYEYYLRTWFPKVCGKLKPTGSLYLCGDWKCTAALQKVMSEHLTILNRITWQREKGRGAKANWKNSMEDIWFGVKDPHAYYFNVEAVKMKRRVIAPYRVEGKPKDWDESNDGNFRLTYPSNFWDDISIPFWSMPENTEHPTQKPEKLYAKLILASSKPGDVIFDPFMGSGTAAVTAKKLGRHYIGVELNDEYCLWAAKRLQMAETDSAIQGYSDGVFWERNTLAQQKIR
ncbi:MAG: site-specific DNA-methyltransferase [Paludibacteraceae bacterium]|nr:site-specific DNA-methyltransferase [Paludibacteraceae bacterium]